MDELIPKVSRPLSGCLKILNKRADLYAFRNMSQLKETCNLLDDTLIDYFDTLESVNKKQEQLDNCMRDGFLFMAKVSRDVVLVESAIFSSLLN